MNVTNLIINSAVTLKNQFNDLNQVIEWVEHQNNKVNVDVTRISFSEMRNWDFENDANRISHNTGKFLQEKITCAKPFLILCGLHTLYKKNLLKDLDLKIFLKITVYNSEDPNTISAFLV